MNQLQQRNNAAVQKGEEIKNQFNDLLDSGYALGSTRNGLTNVYNLKTRDSIGRRLKKKLKNF